MVWYREAAVQEQAWAVVPHSVWWIKIRRDRLGASDPKPRPDHTAQGSSARKIDPHNFWL